MRLNWERWGVVIPAAGGKESWRATRVANPDLVCTPEGKWRMYYNGGNSHHRVGQYSAETIGFAELTDASGKRPIWRDFWYNPVLFLHEGASMEAVIDPAVTFWRGQYLMHTSSWRGKEICFIGLATSNDGLNFRPFGKVFAGRAPEVIVKDDRPFLFYVMDEEETYRIHLAISNGGTNFREHPQSPIFSAIPGTWEGQSVTTPRIFAENGWYYMVYSGDPDGQGLPALLLGWRAHWT